MRWEDINGFLLGEKKGRASKGNRYSEGKLGVRSKPILKKICVDGFTLLKVF